MGVKSDPIRAPIRAPIRSLFDHLLGPCLPLPPIPLSAREPCHIDPPPLPYSSRCREVLLTGSRAAAFGVHFVLPSQLQYPAFKLLLRYVALEVNYIYTLKHSQQS